MKLTNNANLPSPIIKALINDSYDRGKCDFTVTELLVPPRAAELTRLHWDDVVEDASELIWRLIGQIGHAILERAADPAYSEHRFFAKIAGKTVGGRADLHFDGGFYHIWDYKFTHTYTAAFGMKPEWEQQVNMLRWLAVKNKIKPVEQGSICAIYRNWSIGEAVRMRNYPKFGVQVLPVRMWPLSHAKKFIEERIAAHLASKVVLPRCTDEDRWFDKKTRAYKRCQRYCRAYPFCSQANPNLMEESI